MSKIKMSNAGFKAHKIVAANREADRKQNAEEAAL